MKTYYVKERDQERNEAVKIEAKGYRDAGKRFMKTTGSTAEYLNVKRDGDSVWMGYLPASNYLY